MDAGIDNNKRLLMRRSLLLAGCFLLVAAPAWAATPSAAILVYHRFGPDVADGMTTRTAVFEAQLVRLRAEGYTILPLADIVAGLIGQTLLPPKALAITIDDGHRTVHSDLLPIIRRERLPVSLFIYPSAISNANYAMTWTQLSDLLATGTVSVQSHTYWHANFNIERRRLTPDDYHAFIRNQLEKPRRVLSAKLGVDADMLAWPFGIVDAELEAAAAAAGYRAAFALGNRDASGSDSLLALPRYLVVDATGTNGLIGKLRAGEHRAMGSRT